MMDQATQDMERLIQLLTRIESHNSESFSYRLNIDPGAGRQCTYRFVCCENAVGHTILDGSGSTIPEAVAAVYRSLRPENGWFKYYGYEKPHGMDIPSS